jgi:hypothetical protein
MHRNLDRILLKVGGHLWLDPWHLIFQFLQVFRVQSYLRIINNIPDSVVLDDRIRLYNLLIEKLLFKVSHFHCGASHFDRRLNGRLPFVLLKHHGHPWYFYMDVSVLCFLTPLRTRIRILLILFFEGFLLVINRLPIFFKLKNVNLALIFILISMQHSCLILILPVACMRIRLGWAHQRLFLVINIRQLLHKIIVVKVKSGSLFDSLLKNWLV